RRRWFTYLNSDFKRGGWSPEEDVLLCEAQKIFGNRWTEIAKVVSGRGMFLKKDDPKVLALMQQAELLSSLAMKVNSEKTDHSFESAWTALEDFLKQNKGNELKACRNSDTDFELGVEDLHSCNDGSKPDIYDSSPASSEYSTGSTLPSILLCDDKAEEECPGEIWENMVAYTDAKYNEYPPNTEFDSPIHVTPLFRTLAAAIPSPKFSESEKHFLMKTLGIETTSPTPITNPSQPPACKRSLLHCL
ncbi:hypothetical protein M569_08918, partial [Genlisea aurea]